MCFRSCIFVLYGLYSTYDTSNLGGRFCTGYAKIIVSLSHRYRKDNENMKIVKVLGHKIKK